MVSMNAKIDLIIKHEEKIAKILATAVLDKPKISIWMILIPVIFVYYIYQHQKFVDGRKTFVEKYVIVKKLALDEALAAVKYAKEPDIDGLAKMSGHTGQILVEYSVLLGALIGHYKDLLQSEGETFESLVKSTYKNRTNYLLFTNQLNQVERRFNKALKPDLYETTEGVDNIVATMEHCSEKLRREEAEKIFP
jgi:hypothetical protein